MKSKANDQQSDGIAENFNRFKVNSNFHYCFH